MGCVVQVKWLWGRNAYFDGFNQELTLLLILSGTVQFGYHQSLQKLQ